MLEVRAGVVRDSGDARPSGQGEPEDAPENVSRTLLHRLRVVDRLAAYVDAHLDQPLTLDELASVAGLSKFHLHRVVLEQTGLTPAQLVGASRLRRAASALMLRGRRRPRIIEVALSVGFQDPSAFSRSFRRLFGLTPREVLAGATPLVPWKLLPEASSLSTAELSPVTLPSFYCYGHEALGGSGQTFAREAPQAFAVTFDQVERHGVEEVLGALASPAGEPWAPVGAQRLLCAVRTPRRLALDGLTERYVPGGKYIVRRHVGPYESRWQTWHRLSVSKQEYVQRWGKSLGAPRLPFEAERAPREGVPVADVYFPV